MWFNVLISDVYEYRLCFKKIGEWHLVYFRDIHVLHTLWLRGAYQASLGAITWVHQLEVSHRETGVEQTFHHLNDLGFNVLGIRNGDDFVGIIQEGNKHYVGLKKLGFFTHS